MASTRRFFLYTCVFAAVLIGCEGATRFIVALDLPSMSLPELLYLKYDLAERKPSPNQNVALFLGTSITMEAVYAELIDARLADQGLNVEIRNLASPNATPLMDFALLRRAVEAGVKPAVVFYGVSAEFIPKRPDFYSLDEPFVASYLYRCVSRFADAATDRARCLLEKFSYFYRYRGYLKQLVTRDLWTMIADPERFNRKEVWSQSNNTQFEVSNQGWAPAYRVRDRVSFLDYVRNGAPWAAQDAANPAMAESIDRFLPVPDFEPLVAYCETHGIPLVLMWIPPYYPLEKWVVPRRKQALLSAIEEYAKRRRDVHFLEFPEDDDTWHYADRAHKNVFGAVYFSERLAQILLQPFYRDLLQRRLPGVQ